MVSIRHASPPPSVPASRSGPLPSPGNQAPQSGAALPESDVIVKRNPTHNVRDPVPRLHTSVSRLHHFVKHSSAAKHLVSNEVQHSEGIFQQSRWHSNPEKYSALSIRGRCPISDPSLFATFLSPEESVTINWAKGAPKELPLCQLPN